MAVETVLCQGPVALAFGRRDRRFVAAASNAVRYSAPGFRDYMQRRQTMTTTRVPLAILGLLVGVGVLAPGITSVSASSGRSGFLQVEKECSEASSVNHAPRLVPE
jgi:hypothetical protein